MDSLTPSHEEAEPAEITVPEDASNELRMFAWISVKKIIESRMLPARAGMDTTIALFVDRVWFLPQETEYKIKGAL